MRIWKRLKLYREKQKRQFEEFMKKWIRIQEFEPRKSYFIIVGNEDWPATREQIEHIANTLKSTCPHGKFVVAPHYIKFIRLKEVEPNGDSL